MTEANHPGERHCGAGHTVEIACERKEFGPVRVCVAQRIRADNRADNHACQQCVSAMCAHNSPSQGAQHYPQHALDRLRYRGPVMGPWLWERWKRFSLYDPNHCAPFAGARAALKSGSLTPKPVKSSTPISITRSHGLPDVLWIGRSLELASVSPNGTTLYQAYSAHITMAAMAHAVGGPNMAHIRCICTTIINFGSAKHYMTLRVDGHDAPTTFGTQFGHCNE